MKKKLTDAQFDFIADFLYGHAEDYLKQFEIEVDENLVVEVEASLQIKGFRDDDYYNGTGFYVVTDAAACVHILSSYWDYHDDDGECEDVEIEDKDEVEERLVECLEEVIKS